MTNFLIGSILFFLSAASYGQVQGVVPGKYTPGFYSVPNFTKNPNCFANNRNITVSGSATVTRTTSNSLEGNASCSIAGSSSGDKVTFDTYSFDKSLRGQNCELIVTYMGDASKWKIYPQRNSTSVGQAIQLINTYNDQLIDYDAKTVSLAFPCGDLTNSTNIAFEATASTPATFKVTSIQIGKVINLNTVQQSYTQKTYISGGAYSASDIFYTTPTTTYGSGVYTVNAGTGIYTNLQDAVVTLTWRGNTNVATASVPEILMNGNVISSQHSIASSGQRVAVSATDFVPAGSTFQVRNIQGTGSSYNVTVTARTTTNASVYTTQNSNTDWAACSFSTLSWQGLGNVTNNLECKRDGSDLLMRGFFVPGTTSATTAQVPLPLWSGSQLTSAKSVIGGRLIRSVGSANVSKDHSLILTAASSVFTIGIIEYSSANVPLVGLNGSALFNVGENIVLDGVRIPITNWTQSTAITGSFADFNYVFVEAKGNSGQAITASVTDIPFIEVKDTHNAWNGTTFVAPITGIYDACAGAYYTSSAARSLYFVINNAITNVIDTASNGSTNNGCRALNLNKNDTVTVRSNGSGTLNSSDQYNFFTITRIPGQFQ